MMAIVAGILSGCDITPVPVYPDTPPEGGVVQRIRISALTEFVPDPTDSDKTQIKAFVELLDSQDLPIKAACTMRFELYEFRPLSSNPRGRRLSIWPEQNLNVSNVNNEHWDQFLHGYEFYLPLEFVPQQGKKYVFEVSCLVNGQRYHDLFKMRYQP